MNIIGPVSLSEHHSKKYNKHVYIFGEKHIVNHTCKDSTEKSINIIEFFDQILKENEDKKGPIDLYLETEYSTKEKVVQKRDPELFNDWLSLLETKYHDCLIEKKCIYKNVRMHYTDLRKLYFSNLTQYINILFNIIVNVADKKQLMKEENKSILENFHQLDPMQLLTSDEDTALSDFEILQQVYFSMDWKGLDKLRKMSVEDFIKVTKIDKQYRDAPRRVREIYEEYFIPIIEKYLLSLKRNLQFLALTIKMSVGDLLMNEEYVAELMRDIGNLNAIFDAYSFGRMFKKIEPEQEKILLYVGEEHAKVFRILLKDLGFSSKKIESNSFGKDFQCIQTEKFGKFFDSSM
jgi:hypothetical protein